VALSRIAAAKRRAVRAMAVPLDDDRQSLNYAMDRRIRGAGVSKI
jgi:hypothetical protein